MSILDQQDEPPSHRQYPIGYLRNHLVCLSNTEIKNSLLAESQNSKNMNNVLQEKLPLLSQRPLSL